MKTALHFIASLLLFFCFTNATAQEVSADANESEEELPKFVFEKAIVLGASYTHVKFKTVHREADGRPDLQYGGYSSEDFSDSPDITGGILLTFSSPKLSQKLKIATGIFINSYRTEAATSRGYSSTTNSGTITFTETGAMENKISAVYVTMPLMLQVDFSKSPLVPYFKVGPSIGILAHVQHTRYAWYYHDWHDRNVVLFDFEPENRSIAIGASSALGWMFPVSSKSNGIFELGYQVNDGLAPRQRAEQFNQVFSAVLGLIF